MNSLGRERQLSRSILLTLYHEGLNFLSPDFRGVFEAVKGEVLESKHIGTHKGHKRRDVHVKRHLDIVPDFKIRRAQSHYNAKQTLLRLQNDYERQIAHVIQNYLNGVYSSGQLRDRCKSLLKELYFASFELGLRGAGLHYIPSYGAHKMNDEDERWIRSAFNHEMKYFTKFIKDIINGIPSLADKAAGIQMSKMAWEKRLRMYIDASNAVYNTARVRGAHSDSLVYWIMRPEAEHCKSCMWLQSMSPFTPNNLPTTPKAGACICLSNCKCYLRVVPASKDKVDDREREMPNATTLIKKLGDIKTGRLIV